MFLAPMTDLSLALAQQRQAGDLRLELQKAGHEMTTGLAASYAEALNGNTGEIFEIERALATLDSNATGLALAANRAASMQFAMETITGSVGTFGVELEGAVATDDVVSADAYAASAAQTLESVVGALNTAYGGRYLFAGAAETTAPLDAAATIVADVTAIMDAAPDAATALADVAAYFDDPAGGFRTAIYNGATEDGAGVLTPDGDRIDYRLRADDPAFRDMMQGLAIAAAAGQSAFAGDRAALDTLYVGAAGLVQTAEQDVIALRATLGNAEEAIATTQGFVAGEIASLELARLELVGVDPYEAATRFANLENQLSSLYTVTARLSNLTFTNFLR